MSSRRESKLSGSNSGGGACSQPQAKVAAISSNFTGERKPDDLLSDNDDEMLQDYYDSDQYDLDTDESDVESDGGDLDASDLDIAESNIMRVRSSDSLSDID
jgi:hypothetical protein